MPDKQVPCAFCSATGKVVSGYGGYARTTCPVCLGRAKITVPENAEKCRGCNGTGKRITGYHTQIVEKHSDCRGTGWFVRPAPPPSKPR